MPGDCTRGILQQRPAFVKKRSGSANVRVRPPFQIADFLHNSRKDDTVVPVSENTNFLIRDMLEGETDFRNLTQAQVSRIARLLNERSRQTLGMKTPRQSFEILCAKSC